MNEILSFVGFVFFFTLGCLAFQSSSYEKENHLKFDRYILSVALFIMASIFCWTDNKESLAYIGVLYVEFIGFILLIGMNLYRFYWYAHYYHWAENIVEVFFTVLFIVIMYGILVTILVWHYPELTQVYK